MSDVMTVDAVKTLLSARAFYKEVTGRNTVSIDRFTRACEQWGVPTTLVRSNKDTIPMSYLPQAIAAYRRECEEARQRREAREARQSARQVVDKAIQTSKAPLISTPLEGEVVKLLRGVLDELAALKTDVAHLHALWEK
jgi:hypothetical protein